MSSVLQHLISGQFVFLILCVWTLDSGFSGLQMFSLLCADEMQLFEGWFQDLQLAVNECFENPESRVDVETFVQRLSVSGCNELQVGR